MKALAIQGLRKVYGTKGHGHGVEALKGIDLEVEAGDFFGLLGPNGAGKSTAIGIISSLVNKTAGRVEVFGVDLDHDRAAVKRMLGLVPQEINFNQFERPDQIVAQQAGYYGMPWQRARQRAEECLRAMDLWEKHDQPARALSGGMKRRLMIARALVHRPKLLILDEPTAGVDIELRRTTWRLMEQINRDGTTVILTTHYLEEAESLCRRIAIIDRGSIVENTDTKSLIAKLNVETFVVDPDPLLEAPPDLDPFPCRLRRDGSIEVDVERGHSLNELFQRLEAAGIRVTSMRNKANRLEELFVRLTESPTAVAAAKGAPARSAAS